MWIERFLWLLFILTGIVSAQDAGKDLAEQQYSKAIEIRCAHSASSRC